MEKMLFKQPKPQKILILGVLILVFAFYVMLNKESPWSQIITMVLIGLVLFGYSVSYEITKNFKSYKHFKMLGLIIWKQRITLDRPDYISVFSASFKQDNEWGTVSALGTKTRNNAIVIRLFKGNKYFTVYKTYRYENAIEKAQKLGALLGVEVYDATKK